MASSVLFCLLHLSLIITILVLYNTGINVNASINVGLLTERALKSASISVTWNCLFLYTIFYLPFNIGNCKHRFSFRLCCSKGDSARVHNIVRKS